MPMPSCIWKRASSPRGRTIRDLCGRHKMHNSGAFVLRFRRRSKGETTLAPVHGSIPHHERGNGCREFNVPPPFALSVAARSAAKSKRESARRSHPSTSGFALRSGRTVGCTRRLGQTSLRLPPPFALRYRRAKQAPHLPWFSWQALVRSGRALACAFRPRSCSSP